MLDLERTWAPELLCILITPRNLYVWPTLVSTTISLDKRPKRTIAKYLRAYTHIHHKEIRIILNPFNNFHASSILEFDKRRVGGD